MILVLFVSCCLLIGEPATYHLVPTPCATTPILSFRVDLQQTLLNQFSVPDDTNDLYHQESSGQRPAPERVNIYEIMSKPLISIHPRMDERYCARLFDRFDLSLAPVIDQDQSMIPPIRSMR